MFPEVNSAHGELTESCIINTNMQQKISSYFVTLQYQYFARRGLFTNML